MSVKEKIRPHELAAMAADAVGTEAESTSWIVDWVKADKNFLRDNLDEIVACWARNLMARYRNDERRNIVGGSRHLAASDTAPPAYSSQLSAAINANFSRLMDRPIWGGKKIADATPEEIRASARDFSLRGNTMLREARFNNLIADAAEKNGVGINEPVRTGLSPKTFEQLWEESDAA
ncbi:MAG: hypothetical protein ACTHNA_14330 [Sphingopyxis terrae]|uniref:hypothetical protein n=1 Tax=Sphingopyxis terrae TaxID=33052 RepID=UPI003F7D9AD5